MHLYIQIKRVLSNLSHLKQSVKEVRLRQWKEHSGVKEQEKLDLEFEVKLVHVEVHFSNATLFLALLSLENQG